MTDKVTEAPKFLDAIATKGLEYLSNTEVFLKEQIPDYLEQLIKWKTYQNIGLLLISLLSFFIMFRMLKYYINKQKRYVEVENERRELSYGKAHTPIEFEMTDGIFLTGISLFLTVIPITLFSLNVVKLIVAPKVYLIEYFQRLIN